MIERYNRTEFMRSNGMDGHYINNVDKLTEEYIKHDNDFTSYIF